MAIQTPSTPHQPENKKVNPMINSKPLQSAMKPDFTPSPNAVKNVEANIFIEDIAKVIATTLKPVKAIS
jgi:hypothetical protein